jgi:hypothetical protein
MSKLLCSLLVVVSTSLAHANALTPLAPAPGVETARITGPIPWCEGILPQERWTEPRIAETAAKDDGLFAAAHQLCQRPHDLVWKRTARNLLQRWINTAKQSQKDAIRSIRARLDPQQVAADLSALCSSKERVSGILREIAGCPIKGYAPVAFYLDRRGFQNELQRLYWAYKHLDGITSYVLLERDFPISHAKLERDVAASSFATNAFARARVSEALAMLEWRKRRIEMQIATDPDAAFMRETVDRALLEWETLVAEHRDDLAAITTVDRHVPMQSEDLAGCSARLDEVFSRRLVSYDTRNDTELKRRIDADPLAALILSRLAICHAVDHIPDAALIGALVQSTALVAGPRSYAAHVLAKAIAKAGLGAKVVHPIAVADFLAYAPETPRLQFSPELAKGPRGVVSDIDKIPNGIRVTLSDGSTTEIPRRYATKISSGVRVSLGKGGVVLFVSTTTADPHVLAFLGFRL